MKNIFYIVMLATFCFSNHLLAISVEKPITISHSYSSNEAVYILVGTRWLGAEALSVTPQGTFVLEGGSWLSIEEAINCDSYWTWTCRNCGAINVQGNSSCSTCGKYR